MGVEVELFGDDFGEELQEGGKVGADVIIHVLKVEVDDVPLIPSGVDGLHEEGGFSGLASGLVAATPAILGKGGARIVVNYSSSAGEAEATADLCRAGGAEVVVVQGDVSKDEDCKKIVAAAAPWGRIDALINNAGITKHVPHADLD